MFLSVIIPCYNAEKYVEKAVNALISQTGDVDYEIILVNDGSTDGTANVIRQISSNIDKVLCIEQTNGGVSSARNLGLSVAKGEYVYFLDVDDSIAPNTLMAIQTATPAEVILFGYQYVQVNGRTEKHMPVHSDDYLRDYLLGSLKIHMCSIVFKRALLTNHHIRFSEGIYYGEDREFIRKSLLVAKSVNIIPQILFSYIANPASSTNVPYSPKRLTSLSVMLQSYMDLKGTHYESYAKLALYVTIVYNYKNYLKTSLDRSLDNQFEPYLQMLSFPRFRLDKYSLSIILLVMLKKANRKLFDFILHKAV